MNRRLSISVAALAASALVGVGVSSAARADTDPVTGGTVTVSVPSAVAAQYGSGKIFFLPVKPDTETYDAATDSVEFAAPVTGGDASTQTFYGTLKIAGGLVIKDYKTNKSVTFGDLTFDISSDVISGTPKGSTTPVALFDAYGQHDYTATPQPETFSASSVQIDPEGSKFLNTALKTKAFPVGGFIGSFSASWTNSVDS